MPIFLCSILNVIIDKQGPPWWLSGKESACNAGAPGSIPGSGRSPGERNDNPFQFSCLGNPMDRGAGWAIVPRVAGVRRDSVTKQLSPLHQVGYSQPLAALCCPTCKRQRGLGGWVPAHSPETPAPGGGPHSITELPSLPAPASSHGTSLPGCR